jgi:NAD dependent epimerase/dehydratase family enzyme
MPTRALAQAAEIHGAPLLWLQMSTLAIYGDGGEVVLDEESRTAEGPEQMAGVAKVWEAALTPIPGSRIVFMRTGIVLDAGTPALNRLETITKLFLGGSVGNGKQWVSWIHIKDFIAALNFLVKTSSVEGVVHVNSRFEMKNSWLRCAQF